MSKEKDRERARRWRAAHKDKYKATLEEYKAKKAPYEEIADEPERKYKTIEEMYCEHYDPAYLSCIQCYENQTGKYKACYKRG